MINFGVRTARVFELKKNLPYMTIPLTQTATCAIVVFPFTGSATFSHFTLISK